MTPPTGARSRYTRAVPDACCSAVHPLRVTLERRRSDFERDARVTPFTGSCCCCCCCLHWIAAGVGGIAGMRTPTEVYTGALYLAAVLPAVVFLPVGLSMMLAASLLRRRKLAEFKREASKLPQRDGADAHGGLYRMKIQTPPKTKDPLASFSVFCRHCWEDLGESLHLEACPACGVAIDRPVISGPDYGMSVARRATWRGLGMASAGMMTAYALMALLAMLFSK
jgi:hypothetical protein